MDFSLCHEIIAFTISLLVSLSKVCLPPKIPSISATHNILHNILRVIEGQGQSQGEPSRGPARGAADA